MTLKQNETVSDPYLETFDRTVTLYAQSKNISKEEALNLAIKELESLENPQMLQEIKNNLESSISQVSDAERKWEEKNEKEKYPHLYLLERMNNSMREAMDVPKEIMCKALIY